MIIFLVLMVGSLLAALTMKQSPMIMTQTELMEKTEEVLEKMDDKTAG